MLTIHPTTLAILCAIALLFGAAVAWWLKPCSTVVQQASGVIVEHQIDTLYRVVQRPPIVVDRVRPHVEVHDTTVVTWEPEGGSLDKSLSAQPFEAAIDTVIARDTISARFSFPPPAFSVVLRPAPDSIMERNVQTIVTQEVYRAPAWYEEAGKFLLGAVGGYAVRALTEPR